MPGALPHLRQQGAVTKLIVDDEPYLILGGELHNSSASSLDYMEPVWERLTAMHLNTVLAVVSWELVEPEEGRFDFALVDGLIEAARAHDLRLVLLWFGTWKNGMSSYAPGWVKRDDVRFPKVHVEGGRPIEILSTLGEQTLAADRTAYAALMRHLQNVDGQQHTVIMVQVQNEVGVLGDSRDRSPAAEQAFAADVPAELMQHLQQHRDELDPVLLKRWEGNSLVADGSWQDVFGSGMETDEIFMAWHYARYLDQVTAAGKTEYPLPMFANAWLSSLQAAGWASGGQRPGEWPSGGPLPHTLDIWLAGAPHLDFLAPDIYQPNFADWCTAYRRRDNPLFIPEMTRSDVGARQLFYALGEHDAIGVSPFGIDAVVPEHALLTRSYGILRQLAPRILQMQGSDQMIGFLLDEEQPVIHRRLGGYELEIRLDEGFGQAAERGGGLIMSTAPDEFFGAGFGFRVSFRGLEPEPSQAGLIAVDEGTFINGTWTPRRRLNGDETGRGHFWRFRDHAPDADDILRSIQGTGMSTCTVYRYRSGP
ncbi:MAG: DUF5597 domain-containing protein [Gemmatimonadetes bacterium]|jgi:hypothetical protein|nr:DUF5597 domain-containing protein [Gemmatimonadota bacterium]MBT6147093.1 DUF5597 domain-containing protein [Gemmatimonadota bacterium]MBT7862446.1 DUF5597 domain-containing protein [Gemmatimonadota bacterium]